MRPDLTPYEDLAKELNDRLHNDIEDKEARMLVAAGLLTATFGELDQTRRVMYTLPLFCAINNAGSTSHNPC